MKVVKTNAMKINPLAPQNVARMPIRGGRKPPTSGPNRLPAITPEERRPNAQAERDFGACTATRIVAPDEYPPAIPANKRKPMNCQISEASPISNMVIAIPRLARTSMGLRP